MAEPRQPDRRRQQNVKNIKGRLLPTLPCVPPYRRFLGRLGDVKLPQTITLPCASDNKLT